jgi:hypothetical protein
MRPPDVPELLIAALLLGAVVWAMYNWSHRKTEASKPK